MFLASDGNLAAIDFVASQQAAAAIAGRSFDANRFFCVEGELIQFAGKTYAFTNQWGQQTPKAIDDLIAAFPDAKISCRESEQL